MKFEFEAEITVGKLAGTSRVPKMHHNGTPILNQMSTISFEHVKTNNDIIMHSTVVHQMYIFDIYCVGSSSAG